MEGAEYAEAGADLNTRALYQQMKDETLIIHSLSVMNEECLELSYHKIVEDAAVSATTNTFLPAFTTCWARWRLYHHLDFVDRNVLYVVRDSLIQIVASVTQDPSWQLSFADDRRVRPRW